MYILSRTFCLCYVFGTCHPVKTFWIRAYAFNIFDEINRGFLAEVYEENSKTIINVIESQIFKKITRFVKSLSTGTINLLLLFFA